MLPGFEIFKFLFLTTLKKETSMATLVEFMGKLFKKDESAEVYEYYVSFDRYISVPRVKV